MKKRGGGIGLLGSGGGCGWGVRLVGFLKGERGKQRTGSLGGGLELLIALSGVVIFLRIWEIKTVR